MRGRLEELALEYSCIYCLASPGVWCRTNRGAMATTLHSARSDPVRLAWLDGYHTGKDLGEQKFAEPRSA